MSIRVALNHVTHYRYDRLTSLGPQVIRLRPAPHCRTPILSYSLKVQPEDHFLNWQQDPHSNYLARCVFPKSAKGLRVEVDLVADMTVINPFDFFVEESAGYPFPYEGELGKDLLPYLEKLPPTPLFTKFISTLDVHRQHITGMLVNLNQRIQNEVSYLIRLEPGVQSPEETLTKRSGSCRDSAWLLVQVLRNLGLAARFVSGYLIQLAPDMKSLDGPSGPTEDFTDLHAWAEVYVPGAGWIGLDPTSGLLAGEGHIPLAATPNPSSAAPITGTLGMCEVEFDFSMAITRIHEDPRVTKPYTNDQWNAIDALGHQFDQRLAEDVVRLTIGGEPTFVSIDDMEGPEWNSAAVGPHKRQLSEALIKRLRYRIAPGGLLHYGQGKWYPGESLPRWALACYWRKDGVPIWQNPDLIADADQPSSYTLVDAKKFARALAEELELPTRCIIPAYEDVAYYLLQERKLPVDVDPRDPKLKDPEERARMVRVFERGLNQAVGFVIPIRCQQWQGQAAKWVTGRWPIRGEKLYLLPGDSPVGLRLPLETLPATTVGESPMFVADPSATLGALPTPRSMLRANKQQEFIAKAAQPTLGLPVNQQQLQLSGTSEDAGVDADESDEELPPNVVRTAMCIEPREGRLHVFMPPVERLEDYLDLASAIEVTADRLQIPVLIEGYLPPSDHRIQVIKVTPDPGVIEVNVQPSYSWDELVQNTKTLYEEARLTRLGTEKFDLDGKHTGTGGGNHVVLGSNSTLESPFLRRPDLLKSLIGFWVNHPSLSYLFSGRFIGPTSQAPRVDEGRRDALYELELAFSLVPTLAQQQSGVHQPPWLVDRLFRNLLIDLTGNTHRAEICIDKLYSPDSSSGRLGLVELRGFEMPPHAEMSLTQQLLVRALVSHFWRKSYEHKLVAWGTTLHDRFMLPHFVWSDLTDVLDELKSTGIHIPAEWFQTHFEFRFPVMGTVSYQDIKIELRNAIEPWYVLGEEPGGGGTVRYVDSSVERLQVLIQGLTDSRYIVTCNGRRVPLHTTGKQGEYVAGVRYRAWWPSQCLHPTVPIHTPLVFDILDTWTQRSIGGCMYHVAHPAGRNYETFPINALEAEARRTARFYAMGHSPGPRSIPALEENLDFPLTLDLRRVC
ncbi:MAG: transglutaminase family protein [Pirellulales bacterium]